MIGARGLFVGVANVDDLAALASVLTAAGFEVRPGGRLPGRERVFADDPFGNRIEWIELVPEP